MIRIFYLFFLSPPSPFLPVTPLLFRHFFFFLLLPPLAADPSPCPVPITSDPCRYLPQTHTADCLRPHGSKWLPSPPLCPWIVVVLQCVLVSGLRSVCGFDVQVARFGFGGFRRLDCQISGVTVEMMLAVGCIGMDSICDLWLWVCFVVCCGFVLWCCVGSGRAVFCGAVGFFFFFFLAVDWWWWLRLVLWMFF